MADLEAKLVYLREEVDFMRTLLDDGGGDEEYYYEDKGADDEVCILDFVLCSPCVRIC